MLKTAGNAVASLCGGAGSGETTSTLHPTPEATALLRCLLLALLLIGLSIATLWGSAAAVSASSLWALWVSCVAGLRGIQGVGS